MVSDYETLYTDLGYLFYSIAAADRKVMPAERAKLQRIVQEQWLPMESSRDEVGTDEGHYIDIAFDYANDEGIPAEEAFERFAEHVRRTPDEFDEGLRGMIFRSAVEVASSFAGRNKSELHRLTQLELLFAQHPSKQSTH